MKRQKIIPLVIISLMILLLSGSISVYFLNARESKKSEKSVNTSIQKVLEKKENDKIDDSSKKKEESSKSENQNNLSNSNSSDNVEETIPNNNSVKSNSWTNSATSKSNNSSSTNNSNLTSNSFNATSSSNNTSTQNVVPNVKQEPVVDENSMFYSIHRGNIEMSTQSKCLAAGEEIAFIDTVDINYYRCYEVTSTTNEVMGYYLNIFCESGNCNRYKSMIDMSKYK